MSNYLKRAGEETNALRTEALRLGIVIPRDQGWWFVDEDVARQVDSEMWDRIRHNHEYLTLTGKSGTKRLIREELNKLKEEARKDIQWQRQNTQWKLTIAGVIIAWVPGISGIVIATISLFSK